MELVYKELENGIRLIKLIGKLDDHEVGSIESSFVTFCAGRQVKVVVDLSEIETITPVGEHLLLWASKEVVSRGGSLVLLNPKPGIESSLERNIINKLISVHSDLDGAITNLLSDARGINTKPKAKMTT